MKSKITKFAAAAAIVTVAILSSIFLSETTMTAYAIEQTIEANRNVRHVNCKYFGPSRTKVLKEAWIEYGNGQMPKNVRVDYYNWGGHDMVQVWKEGKTQLWNKNQQTVESFECEMFSAKTLKFVRRHDPKQAVEHLWELQKKGEVRIEIEEPPDKSKPIVVTGIYLPGTYCLENPTLPGYRDVLFVNQTTKLVMATEIYELKNGEYKDCGVWEYQEYERGFDPNIFALEEELPDDVIRITHYTDANADDLGLEQGAYTDKQIAFVVVQKFFEALIAKDYAKAGQLFGGMPADEAEEKFGDLSVIDIVSMGQPIESEKPRALQVPCIISVEKDGEIIEWQPKGPFVRRVYRHAGRWRIIGGI